LRASLTTPYWEIRTWLFGSGVEKPRSWAPPVPTTSWRARRSQPLRRVLAGKALIVVLVTREDECLERRPLGPPRGDGVASDDRIVSIEISNTWVEFG